MRLLLYPFALIMWLITATRNMFYNTGIFKSTGFKTPIICVGNLSTGGTGKSPMVMYLARLLKNQGTVVTLSRGYGRKTKGFRQVQPTDAAENTGDEPLMFAQQLPGVHVFVGENRVNATQKILQLFPQTYAIVLDDAMQHRAIQAGCTVLLTRYTDPFWKDHLLPAGNLRESTNGAARAQLVVVTHCPADLPMNEKETMRSRIKKYTAAQVFFSTVKYGIPQPVLPAAAAWEGSYDSLLCISGIANPAAFQKQAATYAGHVTNLIFADHHNFTTADILKITETWHSLPGKKAVLITVKDQVRMLSSPACLNMLNEIGAVFCQPMELAILDAPEKFDQFVLQYAQTHS
jgi:tetraacyldisaccharide 4'-kinase